jgi:hypothetical protein
VSKAHLLATNSLRLQHQPQLPAQHRLQGGTETLRAQIVLTLTLAITLYDRKSRAWPHATARHKQKHIKCRMHGNSVSPTCVLAMKNRVDVSPCLCNRQNQHSPHWLRPTRTNTIFDLLSATKHVAELEVAQSPQLHQHGQNCSPGLYALLPKTHKQSQD